jgi:hypothetical protein
MIAGINWLNAQVQGYGYKDIRLQQRLEKVVDQFSVSDLGKGFPSIFPDKYALKAFYLLMNHTQTSHSGLLSCFRQNLSLKAGHLYFIIQDSSKLDFTSQQQKEGMGYVSGLYQRGLWLHNGLVLSEQGVPEGMLCQQIIIRDDKDYGKSHQRKQRSFEEKESYKWAQALSCGKETAAQYGCRFVHIMDREADVLEVIRKAWEEKQHFLIRASHDRRLPGKDAQVKKLREHLELIEPVKLDMELPAGAGKVEKHACELKWQVFEVEGQRLSVVALSSLTAPELEWVLLSDLEVKDQEQALGLIRDYKRRWIVEELHKGIKTGCKTEKRQFSSLHATLNSIALLTLMAVWLLRIKVLAQTSGDEDIRQAISEQEQQVLKVLAKQHLRPIQKQKLKEFSAKWLAVLLGNMGGFVGNQDKHMPGWQTLWLGYLRYKSFFEAFNIGVKSAKDMG